MTTAQKMNIDSASQIASINLGLDAIAPQDWSQDERNSFIAALSQIIVSNPARFAPESVSTASAILASDPTANLAYTDVFWSSVIAGANVAVDTELSAGEKIASIGNGVLSLANSAGQTVANIGNAAQQITSSASNTWIIPLAVASFVALLVLAAERRVTKVIG
jgi:hypothetical protein